jgi:IS5 family transposase
MQLFYNLSDPVMEDALNEIRGLPFITASLW